MVQCVCEATVRSTACSATTGEHASWSQSGALFNINLLYKVSRFSQFANPCVTVFNDSLFVIDFGRGKQFVDVFVDTAMRSHSSVSHRFWPVSRFGFKLICLTMPMRRLSTLCDSVTEISANLQPIFLHAFLVTAITAQKKKYRHLKIDDAFACTLRQRTHPAW